MFTFSKDDILTLETEKKIDNVVFTTKDEVSKTQNQFKEDDVAENKEQPKSDSQAPKHTYTSTPTKRKKNPGKVIAGTTVAVLAAAATVIAPTIIYHKRNEEYEISVFSEASTFNSYNVSVKRGATISTLKNKLNIFEGHELEGIYKDPECTELFSDSDKITKDTNIYLKYEKKKYKVTLPAGAGYKTIYSDSVDTEAISWGDPFGFRIVVDDEIY